MGREQQRPWSDLPPAAVVSVMRKLEIDHRLNTVPHVCKGWYVASWDPLCWESMLTERQTDNAPGYLVKKKSGKLYNYFFQPAHPYWTRTSRLCSLVRRSEGRVTSLFLFPFLTRLAGELPSNHHDVLDLVAESCPDLKHLSLEGIYQASEKVMCKLVRNCNKLEIIDFSDCSCFSPAVIVEIGRCCTNFLGFRGHMDDQIAAAVGTHLRSLKFLALCGGSVTSKGLSELLSGCHKLEYLSALACFELDLDDPSIRDATSRIPEFCARETDDFSKMISLMFDVLVKGKLSGK